ncbi:MAG: DegV family protein [Eubacteriales bacterium]|nr:DegV family protein [Eubacteriales bacterium]
MSFALYTDSSANLTEAQINEHHIKVVSLTVSLNGEEIVCYEPGVVFDHAAFVQRMREDSTLEMKTSMVNTATFLAAFESHLKAGEDVLYLAMSGGISGTCGCSQTAAEILRPKFPERKIVIIDSLTAVAGEGMIVLEAAKLRESGAELDAVAAHAERRSHEIHSYIMVDDLNFLKRGGRISGSAALAGSIVHLKPVLKGDEEGRLVLDQKIFGRKKALKALLELYRRYHVPNAENREVGITHTDCEEEAHLLAADVVDCSPGVSVTVSNFEPCTASHVGPGSVGLFFF